MFVRLACFSLALLHQPLTPESLRWAPRVASPRVQYGLHQPLTPASLLWALRVASPTMQYSPRVNQLDPRSRLEELDQMRGSLSENEYLEKMRDIVQSSSKDLEEACVSGDNEACEELNSEEAAKAAWLASKGMSGGSVAAAPPKPKAPGLPMRVGRLLLPLALAGGATALFQLTSSPQLKPITMEDIVGAQRKWGDAIVRISKTYLAGGDFVGEASKAADELYGYGRSQVLFKPTKASENPFRPTGEEALSYFVGGDAIQAYKAGTGYSEDSGFALNYGKGFKKVVFDNNQVDFNGITAQAQGEYYFYSAGDDSVAKVEYTFGYKRNDDGQIRIYLHHSSLPYQKKAPTVTPITMDEVIAAQRKWGDAILRISKTSIAGGDYVAEAKKAADELYGYGRSNVLFKPTKASENPFRPTGEEAMSYFVGGDKIEGGYKEDKGFALGPGGKGWKKVTFDNNQFDFEGGTALAMGEYFFTSAADDSVAKVEYTFGYKRNDDGQIRIYLHHSSLPYVPH
jgi:hypothetical protein